MIETDASDGVIAGVLQQQHADGEWYPVAYFSKTMSLAECNYEIHDKELLAIVRSLAEWRPELQSTHQKIRIYTDHKALEYFMTTKQLTARQARWAEALAEYHFTMMYRSGAENGKADALTRKPDELRSQKQLKEQYRTRTLLSKEQVDHEALRDLGIEISSITLAPVDDNSFQESLTLSERIRQANKTVASLQALRKQAKDNANSLYSIKKKLLLY